MKNLIFGDFENDRDFIDYRVTLGSLRCSKKLIGLTSAGLLFVDDRIAHLGGYTYHAKLLPWDQITQLRTRTRIGVEGMIAGVVLLSFAAQAYWAGWIAHTMTGRGTVLIPVFGGLFGIAFIVGARRNVIEAKTAKRTWRYTSPPLAYQSTLMWCKEAVEYARRNGVSTQSHVEGGFCCRACGYYLTGSTTGICPECGTDDARFDLPDALRGRPDPRTVAAYQIAQQLDAAVAPPRPTATLGIVLAIASALSWWIPGIGLAIAIGAVYRNRRCAPWLRAIGWVSFGLAALVSACIGAILLMEHRW